MNFACLLRTVAISVATFTTFSPPANALEVGTLSKAVQAEEARLGARIGMAVFDAKDRTRWAHRGDERFPLNSTHKSFSCAALLKQVDRRVLALEKVISIERASLRHLLAGDGEGGWTSDFARSLRGLSQLE